VWSGSAPRRDVAQDRHGPPGGLADGAVTQSRGGITSLTRCHALRAAGAPRSPDIRRFDPSSNQYAAHVRWSPSRAVRQSRRKNGEINTQPPARPNDTDPRVRNGAGCKAHPPVGRFGGPNVMIVYATKGAAPVSCFPPVPVKRDDNRCNLRRLERQECVYSDDCLPSSVKLRPTAPGATDWTLYFLPHRRTQHDEYAI